MIQFRSPARSSLLLRCFASPAFGQGNLGNPAALKRAGAGDLQGALRHQQGRVRVRCNRAWAPNGADRFYNLVKNGFYDNVRFFRVISGFMVQFGINGDPADLGALARRRGSRTTRSTQSNKRGFITFAMAGPNTRTSQVFINFGDNARPRPPAASRRSAR